MKTSTQNLYRPENKTDEATHDIRDFMPPGENPWEEMVRIHKRSNRLFTLSLLLLIGLISGALLWHHNFNKKHRFSTQSISNEKLPLVSMPREGPSHKSTDFSFDFVSDKPTYRADELLKVEEDESPSSRIRHRSECTLDYSIRYPHG